MPVKNAYPELPEVAYQRTSIDENQVAQYIDSLDFPLEVKRATYIFFVNESGHGAVGINNNYGGIQADGARWASIWDSKIVATTVTPETMTGNERRFCVFDKWEFSIDLLLNRIQSRGIYIGGHAHPYANFDVTDVADFAKAYWQELVEGDQSIPPASQVADIEGLYNKAAGLLS